MTSGAWITGGPLTSIDFGSTGIRDVYQCVQTILATRVGTVFFDRDFGVDADLVDLPILAARQRLRAEVVEKLRMYEPRIRVLEVDFVDPGQSVTEQGVLVPKVYIVPREDALL
ncbi:MAG: GPW/gp25 family protein [Planctomycetaceae bacterium]|nr:GPW/gp25 family protein [Planctomycetaceae bacterium]